MKPTKAKTRKGIINWLAKYNPFLQPCKGKQSQQAAWLYNNANIVAVHIHRHTGIILAYEDASGTLWPEQLRVKQEQEQEQAA